MDDIAYKLYKVSCGSYKPYVVPLAEVSEVVYKAIREGHGHKVVITPISPKEDAKARDIKGFLKCPICFGHYVNIDTHIYMEHIDEEELKKERRKNRHKGVIGRIEKKIKKTLTARGY